MRTLLLTLAIMSHTLVWAQQTHNCGTMPNHDLLIQQDPGMLQRMADIETFTDNYVVRHSQQRNGQTVTIPVVFHIVYNNAEQNISDAQIMSQLQVLNEDFRKMNADWTKTPTSFENLVADTEIEFCLASFDPNGNPTTGITRTNTSTYSFSTNNNIKRSANGGVDAWPRENFLNVWVGRLSGGVYGYAQFPGGPAETDGIVLSYLVVGRYPDNPFINHRNAGRTATHEVGHWLNLRHIWGDASCGDDFVNDTPLHDGPNYGCPAIPTNSSCPGRKEMMHMNYMDYSSDTCMYMFSEGQSARMNAMFAPGGFRESLINSPGCGNQAPCAAATGLNASNRTNTEATLVWDAVTGATAYEVRYRPSNVGANWTTVPVQGTQLVISGLTPCYMYEWEVLSVCDGRVSETSATNWFVTTGCSSIQCTSPANVQIAFVGSDAIMTWDPVSGATAYEVGILDNRGRWSSNTTTIAQFTFTRLKAGQTVYYRLRTICSNDESPYAYGSFVVPGESTTGGSKPKGGGGGKGPNKMAHAYDIRLFPNPATEVFTLVLPDDLDEERMQVMLTDVSGRQILSASGSQAFGGRLELSVRHLDAGMYIVYVMHPDGLLYSDKLIITK